MTKRTKVEGFAGGKRKPPNAGKGREKGVPNKSTASVRAALIEAFEQRGGVPALLRWAAEAPTDFYKLWAKMLPTEVSGPNGGPIQTEEMTDRLAALPPKSREAIRAAVTKALEGKS